MDKYGFLITGHKGARLTFANGYAISIQWGPGNYCGHHDDRMEAWVGPLSPKHQAAWGSNDAEIALFDPQGEWATKAAYAAVKGGELDDDVIGWLSADEVARYIAWAVAQP